MRKIINYRVKLENRCAEKRVRNDAFVISRIQVMDPGMGAGKQIDRIQPSRRQWCPQDRGESC